jgi:hypothetical protein
VDFRHDLVGAGTVRSARFVGFSKLTNGALLAAMAGRFDVLITVDRSLRYQNSNTGLLVSVIVLKSPSNDRADLQPLVPMILPAL